MRHAFYCLHHSCMCPVSVHIHHGPRTLYPCGWIRQFDHWKKWIRLARPKFLILKSICTCIFYFSSIVIIIIVHPLYFCLWLFLAVVSALESRIEIFFPCTVVDGVGFGLYQAATMMPPLPRPRLYREADFGILLVLFYCESLHTHHPLSER